MQNCPDIKIPSSLFCFSFLLTSPWSNIWRVSSLKSYYLCPSCSQSVTDKRKVHGESPLESPLEMQRDLKREILGKNWLMEGLWRKTTWNKGVQRVVCIYWHCIRWQPCIYITTLHSLDPRLFCPNTQLLICKKSQKSQNALYFVYDGFCTWRFIRKWAKKNSLFLVFLFFL